MGPMPRGYVLPRGEGVVFLARVGFGSAAGQTFQIMMMMNARVNMHARTRPTVVKTLWDSPPGHGGDWWQWQVQFCVEEGISPPFPKPKKLTKLRNVLLKFGREGMVQAIEGSGLVASSDFLGVIVVC